MRPELPEGRGTVGCGAWRQQPFSTISVDEDSVLEGNCEEIIIEGVTHILEGLPALPKALLLFTSCIHHFLGTDMKIVFGELNTRFPQVGFVQCWMNPIMRKTKMPPDPFMRKQLYSLLKPADMCTKQVNVIGNNLALRKSSELYNILEKNGFNIKDICTCRDFREYETMASSKLNLVTNPLGRPAAKELCGRLGQEWVYLPVSYDWEQIREHWKCLSDLLELDFDSIWKEVEMDQLWQKAETTLETLAGELAGWSVAIDYTASSRPFGMAKLLVKCGFRVERIYADTISPEEEDTFAWLKKQCPRMLLCPTVYHKMAVLPRTWVPGGGRKGAGNRAEGSLLYRDFSFCKYGGGRRTVRVRRYPGAGRHDGRSCRGRKGYGKTDTGKGMGVLLLKRTNRILPVYAADISGICSALYELGGMTVMHDASGCNSTYTTHDEPRWYSMDSMVYISALSELEAVMGDDEKLVRDIVDAALNLCPAFICIGGTPIPMMMGTDLRGLPE